MGSRRGRHLMTGVRALMTTCRRGAPPETGGRPASGRRLRSWRPSCPTGRASWRCSGSASWPRRPTWPWRSTPFSNQTRARRCGQVPDLDQRPHPAGDHLGEPGRRSLAHRQRHLPDHHLRRAGNSSHMFMGRRAPDREMAGPRLLRRAHGPFGFIRAERAGLLAPGCGPIRQRALRDLVAELLPDPGDDVGGGRAGGEDLGHAHAGSVPSMSASG